MKCMTVLKHLNLKKNTYNKHLALLDNYWKFQTAVIIPNSRYSGIITKPALQRMSCLFHKCQKQKSNLVT